MVKIQCGTCQMILSLPGKGVENLYVCEYCKALIKAPANTIGTRIVIKDFTILKKSILSNNEADVLITHQISLDRLAILELPKKTISVFFLLES